MQSLLTLIIARMQLKLLKLHNGPIIFMIIYIEDKKKKKGKKETDG